MEELFKFISVPVFGCAHARDRSLTSLAHLVTHSLDKRGPVPTPSTLTYSDKCVKFVSYLVFFAGDLVVGLLPKNMRVS